MENYSLADIRAAMGEDGFGGGNGWWLILLFLFLGRGGGFYGGGGNPVTEADLCNANSFSELKGQIGRLSDQLGNTYMGLQNGLSNFGYETLRNFNGVERQIADCCCTTQRAIDSVRFDMANYAAAANANTTAGIQKILDKMCEDKEAQMAARIQQLELQQAMCGVVRYPLQATYAVNPAYPHYNNCGCGCNV